MITAYLRSKLENSVTEWSHIGPLSDDSHDLERFWVECITCTGLPVHYDPIGTDRVLEGLKKYSSWEEDHSSPLKIISNATSVNGTSILSALVMHGLKIPMFGDIADTMKRQLIFSSEMMLIGKPDIRFATYNDLVDLNWVTPLIAATFCFWRKQKDVFPIDNTVITWLRTIGHDINKTTCADMYQWQMMLAIQELSNREIDLHQGYKDIWTAYYNEQAVVFS